MEFGTGRTANFRVSEGIAHAFLGIPFGHLLSRDNTHLCGRHSAGVVLARPVLLHNKAVSGGHRQDLRQDFVMWYDVLLFVVGIQWSSVSPVRSGQPRSWSRQYSWQCDLLLGFGLCLVLWVVTRCVTISLARRLRNKAYQLAGQGPELW